MKKNIYFPNLDALRSIAALFVLFAHITSEFFINYFPNSIWITNPITQFFFFNGSLGVKIFFVLSGFLITYLLLSEIKVTNKINLFNFYMRRILRIWPVYFIVVFFVFVVYATIKQILDIDSPIYESSIMSILFLSNYDLIHILSDSNMYPNGMLSLTWSVSVEEQFYILWPLLFIFVTFTRIKYLIVSVIFIGFVFIMYHFDDTNIIYRHTISNFVFLGAGGLLAYLHIFDHHSLKIFTKMSKIHWLIFFMSLLVLLIFSKEPFLAYDYGYALYLVVTAIFLFFLLLMLTYKVNRPFELSSTPGLLKIAKYTYGLYMYHRIAGFILSVIIYKVMKLSPNIYLDLIIVLLQFGFSFLLAYLSYKYIESPILKYKNKFSIFHK